MATKASLSRLMVATQQVGKDDMGSFFIERLAVVLTCRRWWLHPMPKDSMTHSKLFSLNRDIEPTTESTTVVRPKVQD
jgi:hypothetical protein